MTLAYNMYRAAEAAAAKAAAEARNEGIAIGEKRGISLGITQGAREAKLETAKSMKSENMSVSMIAHFTGLSVEEIEKL